MALLRRSTAAAVHRERDEHRATLRHAEYLPPVKDAFHAFVVHRKGDAVNPAEIGTKAAAHYFLEVGAGRR